MNTLTVPRPKIRRPLKEIEPFEIVAATHICCPICIANAALKAEETGDISDSYVPVLTMPISHHYRMYHAGQMAPRDLVRKNPSPVPTVSFNIDPRITIRLGGKLVRDLKDFLDGRTNLDADIKKIAWQLSNPDFTDNILLTVQIEYDLAVLLGEIIFKGGTDDKALYALCMQLRGLECEPDEK